MEMSHLATNNEDSQIGTASYARRRNEADSLVKGEDVRTSSTQEMRLQRVGSDNDQREHMGIDLVRRVKGKEPIRPSLSNLHDHKEPKEESMMLDRLPPELLQTIFWHMDPGTFFVSLFTCKTLLEAAACKPLLLHHLRSLPGISLGLDDLYAQGLLMIFRKRASEQCLGAAVFADVTTYSSEALAKVGQWVLATDTTSHSAQAHLATVQRDAVVSIYELNKHHVRLKTELKAHPPARFSQTQSLSPFGIKVPQVIGTADLEVLKMAFSSHRDLAVLYRVKSTPKDVSPFVDDGAPAKDSMPLKLVIFHRAHSKMKGYFFSSDLQETRDIESPTDSEPVGLAIAATGEACIAWHSDDEDYETQVILYGRDAKLMEAGDFDPMPSQAAYETGINFRFRGSRQRFRPQFISSDKALIFHRAGFPVHCYYSNIISTSSPTNSSFRANRILVDINQDSTFDRFMIGMPFQTSHTPNLHIPDDPLSPLCRTHYLSLGITLPHDLPNLIPVEENPIDAFVFLSEHEEPAATCSHDPQSHRGIRHGGNWRPVAYLAGYRQGTSSLGTVVATSPLGTKIAAATWDRVLVWSLHPSLLHQGSLHTYFPKRDYNARKDFGRLRPVKLREEGVVHGLIWLSEMVLYANTDRGLVRWDLCAKAEGEREELSLLYDAWPATAVAGPSVGSGDIS